ncbi:MAG: GGDEF domain-containing protein [Glaciecola sp.]
MSSAHHKSISVVLVGLVLFTVISAGYFAISDLAGSQSQQHQQSISPVFSLIEEELIKPLQIASTLAKAGIYDDVFEAQQPNQAEVVEQLKRYQEKFGLAFYLAHEKSRKQFNSSGNVFDLIEGKVIWYFTLKEQTDNEVQAVLGNREDVHLYIDVRQYDEQGNFLGFVGVGKSLEDFLNSFAQFRNNYGHEFVFVNNQNEIVLSSIDTLSPDQAPSDDNKSSIKTTQDLPWHQQFSEASLDQIDPSAVVSSEDGDLLVSKLNLKSLDWHLYVLTPLNSRQQEVNQSYTVFVALGMIGLLILYKLITSLIEYCINKFRLHTNRDPLTQVANRNYAQIYFTNARKKHRQMAVIVADIDNFARINSICGHEQGDVVLTRIAKCMQNSLGKKGVLTRWAGGEFVVIVPELTTPEAQRIANRLRVAVQKLDIKCKQQSVQVSASFGVYCSRNFQNHLTTMVNTAAIAMDKAKKNGKNLVVCESEQDNDTENNSVNALQELRPKKTM